MKEFNKVIGYKYVKQELERIVDMMTNSSKYQKLGVKTTRGLLLHGKPGTGKTLMSKCLIKASKRSYFTIRKDAPDGDFVKNIKKTFDMAKKAAPSIVFLDDLDKFANEDEKHLNAEEFVTIQSCIDDCVDDEVFVLATANSLKNLPRSLLRPGRFDKRIEINTPNRNDCEEIIRYYLSTKKVAKDINYKDIAYLLDGKSCASLETVINEAGVYSGFDNKNEIGMNEIIKSFMRVIYNSPESLNENDSKYIRNNAVHEAGHVVACEVLEPFSAKLATVEKHEGDAGGFTSFVQDEDYFQSMSFMQNRVIVLLAGKAATEIIYGTPDVGVTSDLTRAFSIVQRFVDDYCAYGFTYHEGTTNLDEGNEKLNRKTIMIESEMERYYQKAKRIIAENRDYLEKLTDKLVEKKVLVSSEIQEIKKGCRIEHTS